MRPTAQAPDGTTDPASGTTDVTHTTAINDRTLTGTEKQVIATATLSAYTTGAGGEAFTVGEFGLSRILNIDAQVTTGQATTTVAWDGSITAPKLTLYVRTTGLETGTGANTSVIKLVVIGK